MADGANSGTIETLFVVDLIIGIIMGVKPCHTVCGHRRRANFNRFVQVVFIKFQKICIMIGTSFLGSSMVFNGLFTGARTNIPQLLLVKQQAR